MTALAGWDVDVLGSSSLVLCATTDLGRRSMNDLFSSNGISVTNFVDATVYFLGAMLGFFALKDKKRNWLKHALLIMFVVYWIMTLASPKPLEVKMLATLFMVSIVAITFLVSKRRDRTSRP
jgi:hypothetical protein